MQTMGRTGGEGNRPTLCGLISQQGTCFCRAVCVRVCGLNVQYACVCVLCPERKELSRRSMQSCARTVASYTTPRQCRASGLPRRDTPGQRDDSGDSSLSEGEELKPAASFLNVYEGMELRDGRGERDLVRSAGGFSEWTLIALHRHLVVSASHAWRSAIGPSENPGVRPGPEAMHFARK